VKGKVAIAGGGPAGMMLGLLLARAGIETLVLEKHADFLRDFRGDTLHPSTLEVIAELGAIRRYAPQDRRWRPGLLCIGDAAHAMSPVGGVGINIAIQDAVAAGNFLGGGDFSPANLRRLQRRREWPARATQRLQILAQNRIISRVLQSRAPLAVPLGLRLLARHAWLRRLPGRLIGMGLRPGHIAASQQE
jgi:2-polyprenyl-6-methoxyphenol hydroxylase-like FAD-dependent oxidoreductase